MSLFGTVGQHDDWHTRILADASADLESIHVRQDDVQDDDVRLEIVQRLEAGVAAFNVMHLVAIGFQVQA